MRYFSSFLMPAAASLLGAVLFFLAAPAIAGPPIAAVDSTPGAPAAATVTPQEGPLVALEGPARGPRVSADVVTATLVPARLTAPAGGEVRFKVRLDIADTWHLYDHSYVHDPESFYYGIDLMPAEGADLAAYQPTFPPGQPGVFLGEKVSLIYKNAEIAVTMTMPESAEGAVSVPLVLTVQACDSRICLQPSDIPLNVAVQIQEQGEQGAGDE